MHISMGRIAFFSILHWKNAYFYGPDCIFQHFALEKCIFLWAGLHFSAFCIGKMHISMGRIAFFSILHWKNAYFYGPDCIFQNFALEKCIFLWAGLHFSKFC